MTLTQNLSFLLPSPPPTDTEQGGRQARVGRTGVCCCHTHPPPHTLALQAPRGPPSTSPGSRALHGAPPRPRPQASLCAAPNRTQGSPSSCHEAAGRGRRGCAAEDGSLCPQHPPRARAAGLQRAAPHGLPTGGRQRNGPPASHGPPIMQSVNSQSRRCLQRAGFLDPEPSPPPTEVRGSRGWGAGEAVSGPPPALNPVLRPQPKEHHLFKPAL